jgi:molybdate transport system ATP-binding protein
MAIEFCVGKRLHSAEGEIELDVNVTLAEGEFVTVFGQSGAGKTTLLRMLAGLTIPDRGRIAIGNEVWFDSARRIDLPPQRREIGLVFQDYALFPNMTVRENLTFALAAKNEHSRVDELIEMMQLGALQQRLPTTLSGGQKQRVALARALIRRPRLLLLDEPFSALDAETRIRLQDEILRLHRSLGLTTLIVSHDLGEVYKLSDRVLLIERGSISRNGRPAAVFTDRQVSGKFQFIGEVLAIEADEVVYAVTVLVGNQIVTVIATAEEIAGIGIGDRVTLMAKAFNPMLIKIKN